MGCFEGCKEIRTRPDDDEERMANQISYPYGGVRIMIPG
jgi:hypothetical protein